MLKPPEPGDIVQATEWLGDIITVRVGKLFESRVYGECFDGHQFDEESLRDRKHAPIAYKYVALPISRILQPAKLVRLGRGKWEVTYPDDSKNMFSSQKAAKDEIKERGLTLQEV